MCTVFLIAFVIQIQRQNIFPAYHYFVQIHCVKEVELRGLGEVGIYRVPGYVRFQKTTTLAVGKCDDL